MMETGTEPFRQLWGFANPFAGSNKITDSFQTDIGCSEVGVGAECHIIKDRSFRWYGCPYLSWVFVRTHDIYDSVDNPQFVWFLIDSPYRPPSVGFIIVKNFILCYNTSVTTFQMWIGKNLIVANKMAVARWSYLFAANGLLIGLAKTTWYATEKMIPNEQLHIF